MTPEADYVTSLVITEPITAHKTEGHTTPLKADFVGLGIEGKKLKKKSILEEGKRITE